MSALETDAVREVLARRNAELAVKLQDVTLERDALRAQVEALLRRLGEAQRCGHHAEPPGRVEP